MRLRRRMREKKRLRDAGLSVETASNSTGGAPPEILHQLLDQLEAVREEVRQLKQTRDDNLSVRTLLQHRSPARSPVDDGEQTLLETIGEPEGGPDWEDNFGLQSAEMNGSEVLSRSGSSRGVAVRRRGNFLEDEEAKKVVDECSTAAADEHSVAADSSGNNLSASGEEAAGSKSGVCQKLDRQSLERLNAKEFSDDSSLLLDRLSRAQQSPLPIVNIFTASPGKVSAATGKQPRVSVCSSVGHGLDEKANEGFDVTRMRRLKKKNLGLNLERVGRLDFQPPARGSRDGTPQSSPHEQLLEIERAGSSTALPGSSRAESRVHMPGYCEGGYEYFSGRMTPRGRASVLEGAEDGVLINLLI